MTRSALTLLLLLLSVVAARAVDPALIRWHNPDTDPQRIEQMLRAALDEMPHASAQDYVPYFATCFIGTPYVAATLESPDGVEALTVNLDQLDCTTLVETVIALSLTAADRRTDPLDFARHLESIRYRRGIIDGYPSRLHYISDWIVDNTSRGNLTEVTSRMPTVDYTVKTLDFMTTHPDSYPAFAADPDALAGVRTVEQGYRNHRYPYVRRALLLNDKKTLRALREGDIVALTTSTRGLDVSHLGIITIVGGIPHLLHASSKEGRVVVSRVPLGQYLNSSRTLTGLRLLRLP